MSASDRPWLAAYDWNFVTLQNSLLCQVKSALHKPTLDGHDATKELWDRRHHESMGLDEAVELCRQCHRLAPFCNYNGNTFTAIMRDVVTQLPLDPAQAQVLRSLAGHIVAGVASDWEITAFRDFCATLD